MGAANSCSKADSAASGSAGSADEDCERLIVLTNDVQLMEERIQRAAGEHPDKALLLIGPPRCGKSTAARAAVQQQTAALLLDLMDGDTSTPQFLGNLILEVVYPQLVAAAPLEEVATARDLGSSRRAPDGCIISTTLPAGPAKQQGTPTAQASPSSKAACVLSPLDEAMNVLSLLVAAWQAKYPGQKVKIFIDNVDRVRVWRENAEHAAELKNLGQHLTDLAKMCNLVLITSQYSFLGAMLQDLGITDYVCATMGYWDSATAKAFLLGWLEKVVTRYKCAMEEVQMCTSIEEAHQAVERHWDDIYKTVGGKAMDLARAGRALLACNAEWDVAVGNQVAKHTLLEEMQRRVPWWANCGGRGFTGPQFADACLFIMDNGGVVTVDALSLHLGRLVDGDELGQMKVGRDVLMSLIAGGALQARPYSTINWATDLPTAQYQQQDVVTTRDALQLCCLNVLKDKLVKRRALLALLELG